MHLNSCTLLSAAQPISLAGVQMIYTHRNTTHAVWYIIICTRETCSLHGGGGGGHSLVRLARPYDLIAEGVKVGWS